MKKKGTMKTVMKKKRAMKSAMKKSIIARGKRARSSVFRGLKIKTQGGLTKDKLVKNKVGKVVSKSRSARAKQAFAKTLGPWTEAVKKARKALGISGFCAIGGKSAQGRALYAKAKSLLV